MNLAPLNPLDGGKLAALTSWPGYVLTLIAVASAVADFVGGRWPGLAQTIILTAALYLGFRNMRQPRFSVSHAGRLGLLDADLASVALVYAASTRSGYVPAPQFRAIPGLPSLPDMAVLVIAAFIVSLLAVRYAFRLGRSALVRYAIFGFVGWPWFVYKRSFDWILPCLCAAFMAAGVPVAERWLRRLAGSQAQRRSAAVGTTVGITFDCLWSLHSPDAARAWADEATPWLAAAGSASIESCVTALSGLGHWQHSEYWIGGVVERPLAPGRLPAWLSNL